MKGGGYVMAIEVMRRYENKYLVNGTTYERLQDGVAQFADLDEYNKRKEFYTIANIYYDTDDNHLIRTSISKPKYKEKLRLRGYGVPTELDRVYLEIKKKYEGIVNKRRTALELPKAYEFVSTGSIEAKEYMNKQVLNEIAYFIRLYSPSPKLYLAYERRAYCGEGGLRITFDTNIRTRRHDLKLENGDYGEKLIDDNLWLMEIKTCGVIPLWLSKLLSEHAVYPISFSKYGIEYGKSLSQEGAANKCLIQYSTPQARLQTSHGSGLLPQLA